MLQPCHHLGKAFASAVYRPISCLCGLGYMLLEFASLHALNATLMNFGAPMLVVSVYFPYLLCFQPFRLNENSLALALVT